MIIQRRIPNRDKISAGIEEKIKNKIRLIALRAGCSMSYVTNVLLADQLGIYIEDRYDEPRKNDSNRREVRTYRSNIKRRG